MGGFFLFFLLKNVNELALFLENPKILVYFSA